MPLLATYGDGVTATFSIPVHDMQATATVNGSAAPIQSQSPSSVTLASIPAVGAAVVVSYSPVSGAYQKTPLILAQSAVPASVTGTTSETTLASITVPGGALSKQGSIRLIPLLSYTNNANSKSIKVYFGGVLIYSSTATASASLWFQRCIRNRNALNSQVTESTSNGGPGTSGVAPTYLTVDTTQNQALTITGTLAATGDTITLEGYTVEILNP